jgi:hypothetical protein
MRYHRQQPQDWERRRSVASAPAPKPRQRTPAAASASGGAALAAPGRGGATAFVICDLCCVAFEPLPVTGVWVSHTFFLFAWGVAEAEWG